MDPGVTACMVVKIGDDVINIARIASAWKVDEENRTNTMLLGIVCVPAGAC